MRCNNFAILGPRGSRPLMKPWFVVLPLVAAFLVSPSAADPAKLKQGIGRVFARSGAGAYFLEAVVEASRGFEKREAKRPVMVALMTEGLEFSTLYYQRVLEALEKSRAALHVLTMTGVTA